MTITTLNTKLKGEYNLVINKPDGTSTETGWFDNMILDTGLDRLGVDRVMRHARIGTGTAPPTQFDTQLVNQIAVSNQIGGGGSSVSSGAPDYTTTIVHEFPFAQGAVVGNVTEIGVGWGTTGDTLFSRALIVDVAGSPISITITAIDQLTVYYRLTYVPAVVDVVGTVDISGTAYGYTGRVAQVASALWMFAFANDGFHMFKTDVNGGTTTVYGSGATLGAITSIPSAASSAGMNPSATYTPYVPGTFYGDVTVSMNISQGNVTGGIKAIKVQVGYSTFQYLFDTPIPKDNTKTFSMTFRASWGRL